jgi:hypothetical protein
MLVWIIDLPMKNFVLPLVIVSFICTMSVGCVPLEKGRPFVQALWDTPIPSGKWRYYDGMLYMLGLLHVSGSFKIYTPN